MAPIRLLSFVAGMLMLASAPAAQCELAKLRDADTMGFGNGLAMSGQVAWIGGYHKALAYEFEDGEWVQTLDVPGFDGGSFGYGVAVDSSIAVVGSSTPDFGPVGGYAYVFERHGDTWSLVDSLAGLESTVLDYFGLSVAVSGSTIAVGAPSDNKQGTLAGEVYIFELQPSGWKETAQLFPSDPEIFKSFGEAVALQGDRLLVGAYGDTDGVQDAGSAYIFERQGGVWLEQAHLVAAPLKKGDGAGYSVALDGDLALLGAPGGKGLAKNAGVVYVFEHGGSGWEQTAKLFASDGVADEGFGTRVATSAGRILVGKPRDHAPKLHDVLTAYLFERDGRDWVETKIFPSDKAKFSEFGSSVALSGDLALIGAPFDPDASEAVPPGAVYFLDVDATTVWHDLGSGLAGAGGVPALVVQGELCAGMPLVATLQGAAPGAPVGMIFGLAVAGVPFKGGTLVPQPDAVAFSVTDASGAMTLQAVLPKTVPPELDLVAQAWVVDAGGPAGFAASNAISGTVD